MMKKLTEPRIFSKDMIECVDCGHQWYKGESLKLCPACKISGNFMMPVLPGGCLTILEDKVENEN